MDTNFISSYQVEHSKIKFVSCACNILSNGWLRERAKRAKSCAVIGHPSRQDGNIIGETRRTLRVRFGEHLRQVQKSTCGFPVAEHFNSPGQNLSDIAVRGLKKCTVVSFRQKQLELEIIFWVGSMQAEVLNNVFNFL